MLFPHVFVPCVVGPSVLQTPWSNYGPVPPDKPGTSVLQLTLLTREQLGHTCGLRDHKRFKSSRADDVGQAVH